MASAGSDDAVMVDVDPVKIGVTVDRYSCCPGPHFRSSVILDSDMYDDNPEDDDDDDDDGGDLFTESEEEGASVCLGLDSQPSCVAIFPGTFCPPWHHLSTNCSNL